MQQDGVESLHSDRESLEENVSFLLINLFIYYWVAGIPQPVTETIDGSSKAYTQSVSLNNIVTTKTYSVLFTDIYRQKSLCRLCVRL